MGSRMRGLYPAIKRPLWARLSHRENTRIVHKLVVDAERRIPNPHLPPFPESPKRIGTERI